MFDKTIYMADYMRAYRKEKKDIVAKAQKKWQQNNKEYLKEYMREYRARKKTNLQKEI